MNDEVVQQLLLILTALIASQGFWNMLTNKLSKTSKVERAVKALLHDKLSYLANKHLAEGSITAEDFRVVNDLYDAYRDIGGNGTVARLMEAVQKLEIKTKGY